MMSSGAKPEGPRERAGGAGPPRRHIEHDLLLGALPHPILVLGEDERVLYANAAAESFFSLSQGVLKRQTLPDIIAPTSPLGALVAQVRRTGATVNEYAIEVGLPRSNAMKNAVLAVANGVAAVAYVLLTDVAWSAALPLALGLFAGGLLGPRVVRRSPPAVLRRVIAVAGLGLAVYLGIGAFG